MILNPKGVPILILSGEGHKSTLDLFLIVAYKYYNDKLNKSDTIPILLEEHRKLQLSQKVIQTPFHIAAKSQNLKFPGKCICVEK